MSRDAVAFNSIRNSQDSRLVSVPSESQMAVNVTIMKEMTERGN